MKFKKATGLSAACAVLLLGTAVTVFAQTDLREISIHENDISAAQEEDGVDSSNAAQAEAPAGNAEESMETDLGLIDDLVNSEEFREYEAYGVSYDRESGDLLYNGEPVGFLYIVEENGGEIEMAVALPDDLGQSAGRFRRPVQARPLVHATPFPSRGAPRRRAPSRGRGCGPGTARTRSPRRGAHGPPRAAGRSRTA